MAGRDQDRRLKEAQDMKRKHMEKSPIMQDIVRVDLSERSYDIVIGPGAIKQAGARIAPLIGRRPVIIVTDDTVAPLHLPALEAALESAGVRRNGQPSSCPPERRPRASPIWKPCWTRCSAGVSSAPPS